ncbi:unnamed protein product [Larinioides sclopetarius]|uniref:Uncharacterized protein n=1 Tax=Larinioides sclopetarius TaxID=280406 RepID=A0AAV2ALJ3_9ARAC
MVTVSSPPPQLSSISMLETEEVDVSKMDGLLEKLKSSMVELILQGDDVTRQMWHMYSVFEEIFGRQTMTTSSNQPLKHVVVGDRIKGSSVSPSKPTRTTPTSPLVSSPVSKVPVSSAPAPVTVVATSTTTTLSSPTNSTISASSPKDVKTVSSESNQSSTSPQQKPPKHASVPPQMSTVKSTSLSSDKTPESPKVQLEPSLPRIQKDSSPSSSNPMTPVTSSINPTSNPLLDTIGVLASSNPDSDDSDLDIVYQQLRYRGRQRKPEQMRIRTHRAHRHQQQVASSDPESIGYAGSNSIDSGYKSLCATPEVSDSLSAPEVRRSASDVSASDSSTTSGRPRSLDGQDGKSSKIKMGTRSITGKLKAVDRSPRHVPSSSAMNDVNLDHLMYLRQSLRKDRPDAQRSPNDSITSSATSSTFRDSDLSPRTVPDDDWRDQCRPYPFRTGTSSSSESTFTVRDGRSSRESCRGEDIDQEGGGESSSDFLLSGVEYYDLESIQEFPPGNNYVTMLEEKTRCARFQLVSASKCAEPHSESHLSSLYRKRSESAHSVEGDIRSQQQQIYGVPSHTSRSTRSATKLLSRHHRPQHHTTDSKLTEAAIRVLEMIEDFRMEEAITRSSRVIPYRAPVEHSSPMLPSASGAPSNHPSVDMIHQAILPRYRRTTGMRSTGRPASTGSLMEQEIDARSVASASSYAASAEHHVYEEIMYDLVCERERAVPPPIPPERIARSRLLPMPPSRHQQAYAASMSMDPRRAMVRSPKHRSSSSLYSVLSNSHGRSSVDRYLELEWHLAQERRGNLPPDFPV